MMKIILLRVNKLIKD